MLKNQFPIGKFQKPESYSEEDLNTWIDAIEGLPDILTTLTTNASDEERHATYREGSFDVQTLIHHIADSHMHGFIRTKQILTEDHPYVTSFLQDAWADAPDNQAPLEYSLELIDGMHKRWAILLRELPTEAFDRTFFHPEEGEGRLADLVAKMAWHGNHHLEHIKLALKEIEES
ncbi:YfiT family bacillithiol transferase [Staphylococcus simulans]|uniref:YfiT family bacillithiol transferase n=1 Tax=Staphylococcus simulans TaxID=1286 RepID=UPI00399A3EEB